MKKGTFCPEQLGRQGSHLRRRQEQAQKSKTKQTGSSVLNMLKFEMAIRYGIEYKKLLIGVVS